MQLSYFISTPLSANDMQHTIFVNGENLQNLVISVGAITGQNNTYTLCADRDGLLDLVELVECTSPVFGRYVMIVQQTDGEQLNLHEVEVWGH